VVEQNIGIQLASLRQPFKKALHTAARLGARGVEIDARDAIFREELSQSALRQLRKMLDDLNLRVSALAFQTPEGYGQSEGLDRRVAATMRAQRLAYQLRAPVVVNQVGTVPAEASGPQWDRLLDSLAELGRHGQHVGALLAAETGSEAGADLRRLVEAVPGQPLVVDLNPAKLITHGFSARDAAEQLAGWVAHVHACDAVRDLARGRGMEVPLGQGAAQFPELLGLLENHRYRGFLTIEYRASDEPARDIQMAIQYLRNL